MMKLNSADTHSPGVHGIFHVASPVNFSFVTFEQTIFPAVKGSENVLESALKAGPQLASVVFTSSMGAIIDPTDEPNHVFTENHFAAAALNRAIADRDAGRSTPGSIMYAASKTAAERTVWAFRDSHKPPFAITAIHPSVVIGPPVFLPSTGAEVSETILPIFNILSGIAKTIRPNIGSGSFVNVRDVAFIHSWAFEHPEVADGERYIACEGFGPMQATADILRWKYRETEFAGRITVGEPGTGYVGYDAETGEVRSVGYVPGKPRVSGEKAARAMGVRYISYRKSVEDTAEVLQALL
jgi:nucleoside-diphosphate-sugar epimerase